MKGDAACLPGFTPGAPPKSGVYWIQHRYGDGSWARTLSLGWVQVGSEGLWYTNEVGLVLSRLARGLRTQHSDFCGSSSSPVVPLDQVGFATMPIPIPGGAAGGPISEAAPPPASAREQTAEPGTPLSVAARMELEQLNNEGKGCPPSPGWEWCLRGVQDYEGRPGRGWAKRTESLDAELGFTLTVARRRGSTWTWVVQAQGDLAPARAGVCVGARNAMRRADEALKGILSGG